MQGLHVAQGWLTVSLSSFASADGFSVMHAIFMVINSTQILDMLDVQEIYSMLIAGYCHDVGHDGVNNTFHVGSGSDLALTYNDNSVLENMHAVGNSETEPQCLRVFHTLLTHDVTLHYELITRSLCPIEIVNLLSSGCH